MLHNTLLHVFIYLPIHNLRSKIPRTIESFVSWRSSTIPQALDSATDYGIWGYLGAITLYITYALLKDAKERFINSQCCDRIETHVEPQSEEMQTTSPVESEEISMGVTDSKEQNVSFADTHPGYVLQPKSVFDPLRDDALESDATLDEFFSRPLKIYQTKWSEGAPFHDVIDPWSLYFENPRVINRISNYKLLRSKLHLKIVVNGNAFHYGRAVISYNPFRKRDDMTVDRDFVRADFIQASQRPHVMIDPTNSQGGEMILPFMHYNNLVDITNGDWDELGELVISELNPLKHANGGDSNVSISIFAWAEDCKYAVPTGKDAKNIQPQALEVIPQADEHDGPVSRVAGVVANAAGKLTKIPMIAPFARSTEIGASAMGAIATLFGYSRPAMLETSQYRPITKGNLAVTNTHDDVTKLTVDHRQELTLDPRTAGLENVDELGINYIASRESFFQSFDWTSADTEESLLYNMLVDPGVYITNGSEYHLPACAYAALPFKYWRGSMKFRFQVVCSRFHKGRLKIVYDPTESTSSAEYNTAYTSIVDIADTTDFTVTVGWGQRTSYRQTLPIASTASSGIVAYSSPINYSTGATNVGNGVLSVYVVNELATPDDTINNDIEVNVFVSMGDDFEVAVPDASRLSRLRTTTDAQLIAPQSEEMDRTDSKPRSSPNVADFSATTELTDPTNHVHFGESIRSFRQLLKRYNRYDIIPLNGSDDSASEAQILTAIREMLPGEPGYTSSGGDETDTLDNGDYRFAEMTLLRYLTLGFSSWRGSIRWLYDFSHTMNHGRVSNGQPLNASPTAWVSNYHGDSSKLIRRTKFSDPTGALGKSEILEEMRDSIGHNGLALQVSHVNPTVSFEVPYYSQFRLTPSKTRTDYSGSNFNVPKYSFSLLSETARGSEFISTYCAAGEDFTCFMYLGPPIFYYEGSYPTS